MKVNFDSSFRIQGCEIINYLLEKSRVVMQSKLERNYHIFYQLLKGADAAMKARLRLADATSFRYLNQSGCCDIEGVNDAAEFRDVLDALQTLQFPPETCEAIFSIIAGILHLGNIGFEATSQTSEASKIVPSTQHHLEAAAHLFGVDVVHLTGCLVGKLVQMGRGSVVEIKLNVNQALDSRDTLSKALYGNLFDWTIRTVNSTLKTVESPYFIGILDIFGFEIFELNSFEQLCINYANEKLQFHFNEVIFSGEMSMYEEEGISTEKIEFEDNGECVMLVEGKPYGLLGLLDEECSCEISSEIICPCLFITVFHILLCDGFQWEMRQTSPTSTRSIKLLVLTKQKLTTLIFRNQKPSQLCFLCAISLVMWITLLSIGWTRIETL